MRIISFLNRRIAVYSLLLPVLVLTACGQAGGENGGGMFGGPVPVSVLQVQAQAVPLSFEYTGRTQGMREAEVRARVSGILQQRNFTEGQRVQAGQSLFQLDPAPYAAALARTEADVAAAQARWEQARREMTRLKPLYEDKAVSQKEYDDAVSGEAISAADVQAAKARLQEAKLNLEWTRVESPITGIAGRVLPSEGSLIPGPEVLLTTVTQVDPIRVLFGITDRDLDQLHREAAAGHIRMPVDDRFALQLVLEDGRVYEREGRVDFVDVRVSDSTGTREARADLANPDGILRPGQFVRVRLSGAVRPQAFVLPQRAVLEGPQGKFVYVVDGENKAQPRPVQVGEWRGDAWVITGGLQDGDRVISDGVLKLYPGAPVQVGAPPTADPNAAQAG